jgi:hypothetical protein
MSDATNCNLQYHTRIITNIHRKHRICELCLMWLGASASSSYSNDYSSNITETIGRKCEQDREGGAHSVHTGVPLLSILLSV